MVSAAQKKGVDSQRDTRPVSFGRCLDPVQLLGSLGCQWPSGWDPQPCQSLSPGIVMARKLLFYGIFTSILGFTAMGVAADADGC